MDGPGALKVVCDIVVVEVGHCRFLSGISYEEEKKGYLYNRKSLNDDIDSVVTFMLVVRFLSKDPCPWCCS